MRAIPFLSNWEGMIPDALVGALAEHEVYFQFHGMRAYRLERGACTAIPPTWWENFSAIELKASDDRIKRREISHADGKAKSMSESIRILPAATFVWRDEFEPRYLAKYRAPYFSLQTGEQMPPEERAMRTSLDFDPFIPDLEIQRLVMEGFEQPPDRVVPDLSGRPAIVLPAGTESVDVSDIPRLIAVALYPRLLAQGRLPAGSKELPDDEAGRSRNVQLDILERPYRSQSALAIKNGIRGVAGGLVVRSKQTRSPFIADGDITDAYATVADFRAYVAGTYDMNVFMVEVEPQAAPGVPEGAPAEDDAWKSKARKRAGEIIERQLAQDLYPSQQAIADEIARDFRNDDVKGADGKPLAGSYIKRHALKGISSARDRQLSMKKRRGK